MTNGREAWKSAHEAGGDSPPQKPAAWDVAVAYRIYPHVAPTALGLPCSEDKLRLSEICLRSFKRSLGTLRVKLWVLLDGCPEEYAALFRRHFDPQDLVLLSLPGVGNLATFGKQMDLLLEQEASDLVYFAEDDYLYLPNQFPKMVEYLRDHDDVDFVSPYDHPDCYTLEIHRNPKWVRVYAGHHWRTAASTCLTFLTRKETLRQSETVFRTYCQRNHDCSMWLSLTKKSVFSPGRFSRFLFREPAWAKMMARAWLRGWPQILFGKRMGLWIPIPGMATHLDLQRLSPGVDWRRLMEDETEALAVENARRLRHVASADRSARRGS
jgi:hypothetical protein